MKRLIRNIVFISLILFLSQCSDPAPLKDDFIGIWKSDDGAFFDFKSDSTFHAENLAGDKILSSFPEYRRKRYNANGKWHLRYDQGSWEMGINFNLTGESGGMISTELNIEGGKRLLQNKPPRILFAWIGDPDEMNRYEFKKQ